MSDIALSLNGVTELQLGGRLLGDERLAKLAGRGSERAFATLYERHHQAIYRYCRSILHNDHDAQDALQSAMMRAYAALRAQERDLAVKPWLFRIAHNEAISIVRKRRVEHELSDDYEQLDSGVEGTLEARERLATLVADLQALPERQRAALLMRELSGLSIQQIAGALEMSPGAAKQTLFEARSSLHEISEGRAMQCESVRRAISQRDGRVLRSRRIRAHLRACDECKGFRAAIATRSADLAVIAPPLPASIASAVLVRLLAHGGGHSGGVVAVSSGASVGGHAAASLFVKGLAGVAVVAAATAGTVHFAASPHRHHPEAVGEERSATAASANLARSAEGSTAGAASAAKGSNAGAARGGIGPYRTLNRSQPALGGFSALANPGGSSGRGAASFPGGQGHARSSLGGFFSPSPSHGNSHNRTAHSAPARHAGGQHAAHPQTSGGSQRSGSSHHSSRTHARGPSRRTHPSRGSAGQPTAPSKRKQPASKAPSRSPAGGTSGTTSKQQASGAPVPARSAREARPETTQPAL
jgi:RNA polymerase sigma factor (sigma-70 family)